MNPKFTIKTIAYYPLLLIMVFVCVSLLFLIWTYNLTNLEFIFLGVVFLGFWYIFHHLLSGKFIADIKENNHLSISWIKKPILSTNEDRIIKVDDIMKVYRPINLSWAPDKFVIKIKDEKDFSFFVPIFKNNKGLINFESVLRYFILQSSRN